MAEFVGDSNVMAGTVTNAASRRVTLTALGVTATAPAGGRLAPGPVEILIRPERMSVVTGATTRESDIITVTLKVAAVTHFATSPS